MAAIIYLLCAFASIGCCLLLALSFTRSRNQLLLWSAICFACLALSNILLFIDIVVVPHINLSIYRSGISLIGLIALLFGLIKETAK